MIGEISNLTTLKLFFVALVGANGVLLHFLQQELRQFKEDDDVPNIFMFQMIAALSVSKLG